MNVLVNDATSHRHELESNYEYTLIEERDKPVLQINIEAFTYDGIYARKFASPVKR